MTEGFSGADLQALLYNAHLEVIHASIAADSSPRKEGMSRRDEPPVRYATFGGPPDRGVASKAEEAALQRRVRFFSPFCFVSMIRY
jgi:peroxin-1